ncbi:hypothetical protein VTJ49DRAFT_5693 [Mycothermus thermophilus]|uniref:VanZ-like domain-containing protein n=1 Tax=Humicola insolens TaxID=85995 RepID=A0ABR3V3Q8_HUMIN
MRIRLPFAGAFATLLLISAYLGLSPSTPDPDATPPLPFPFDDKGLHFLTFFILTVTFYWVVDTTRRRATHLSLLLCTAGLGIGSEVLQALLPNGREFDLWDIVANVVGSLAGLGLCAWYHRRMLERRRRRKYTAVPTTTGEEGAEGGEEDVELGEGVGLGGRDREDEHEEGVTTTTTTTAAAPSAAKATTLEEEVDNWDENAEDAWDEDDEGDVGVSAPAAAGKAGGEGKKRSD